MEKSAKQIYINISSVKYDCAELKEALTLSTESLFTLKPTDHIEVETEGELRVIGKRYSVVYNEDDKTGMPGTRSILSFLDDERESVKIMRSGTLRSSFDVSRGHTSKTNYTTSFFNFDMNVIGCGVINKITESGGELILDYILEIPYTLKERTLLTLTVKPKESHEAKK